VAGAAAKNEMRNERTRAVGRAERWRVNGEKGGNQPLIAVGARSVEKKVRWAATGSLRPLSDDGSRRFSASSEARSSDACKESLRARGLSTLSRAMAEWFGIAQHRMARRYS
jgi:hypothetical protein